MGAVVSLAKKVVHGVETGVHDAVSAVGHVVGTVSHAVIAGADGLVHTVEHVPGVGWVVHKVGDVAKDVTGEVAKIAPMIAKGAQFVSKVAPMFGPEGAEIGKAAAGVSRTVGMAGKVANVAHQVMSDGNAFERQPIAVFHNEEMPVKEIIHMLALYDQPFQVVLASGPKEAPIILSSIGFVPKHSM